MGKSSKFNRFLGHIVGEVLAIGCSIVVIVLVVAGVMALWSLIF